MTTSRCLISQTVLTHTLISHGGFPLRATIDLSRSSLRTPPLRVTVNWWPFITICIYLHLNACCFLFLLLPVSQTICNCASWVLFLVAALAVSRWTIWCPHCCFVPMSNVFDIVPANRLDFAPLPHDCGGCVAMVWRCGTGEADDNEKKWEVLRTI